MDPKETQEVEKVKNVQVKPKSTKKRPEVQSSTLETRKISGTDQTGKSDSVSAEELAILKADLEKEKALKSTKTSKERWRQRVDEIFPPAESSSSSSSQPMEIGLIENDLTDLSGELLEKEGDGDDFETSSEKEDSETIKARTLCESLPPELLELIGDHLGISNDFELKNLMLVHGMLKDTLNSLKERKQAVQEMYEKGEHTACSRPFPLKGDKYLVREDSDSYYADTNEEEEESSVPDLVETDDRVEVQAPTVGLKASQRRALKRKQNEDIQAKAGVHKTRDADIFGDLMENQNDSLELQDDDGLLDINSEFGENIPRAAGFINVNTLPPLYVTTTVTREILLKVENHIANAREAKIPYSKMQIFGEDARFQISAKLVQAKVLTMETRDDWLRVKPSKDGQLLKRLLELYPAPGKVEETTLTLSVFEKISFDSFRLNDENSIAPYCKEVRKAFLVLEKEQQTVKNFHKVVKTCGKTMKAVGKTGKYMAEKLEADPMPNDPMEMEVKMLEIAQELKHSWSTAKLAGFGSFEKDSYSKVVSSGYGSSGKNSSNQNNNKRKTDNHQVRPEKSQQLGTTSSEKNTGGCDGCGQSGHPKHKCGWKSHPDFNSSDLPWSETRQYKSLIAHNMKPVLVGNRRVDGRNLDTPILWKREDQNSSSAGHQNNPGSGYASGDSKRHKSQYQNASKGEFCLYPVLNSVSSTEKCDDVFDDYFTIPVHVLVDDNVLNAHLLMDTGSSQANFMSRRLAHQILRVQKQQHGEGRSDQEFGKMVLGDGGILSTECTVVGGSCTCSSCTASSCNNISSQCICDESDNLNVCTALKQCARTTGCLSFVVSIFDEVKRKYRNFRLNFYILPDLNYDLIIGLPDIKKNKFFALCPSFLSDEQPHVVKKRVVLENSECANESKPAELCVKSYQREVVTWKTHTGRWRRVNLPF